jgi:hypothetical protein
MLEIEEDDFFDNPIEDGVYCVYCGKYMIDDCERGRGCHFGCEAQANAAFDKVIQKHSNPKRGSHYD